MLHPFTALWPDVGRTCPVGCHSNTWRDPSREICTAAPQHREISRPQDRQRICLQSKMFIEKPNRNCYPFRKISVGMSRSACFPAGTTGFSIQAVNVSGYAINCEALLGVLGIRDNRKNNYGDKG